MKKLLIVAGSRDFCDYDLLKRTLDEIIKDPEEFTIVSGTAKGADMLGEKYAAERGISLKRCPADWKKHGNSAGIIRNEQMAKLAANSEVGGMLCAFWDGNSPGTRHMISCAEKLGIPTKLIADLPQISMFDPETCIYGI